MITAASLRPNASKIHKSQGISANLELRVRNQIILVIISMTLIIIGRWEFRARMSKFGHYYVINWTVALPIGRREIN